MSNIIYPEIVERSITNSAVKNETGDQNPKIVKTKNQNGNQIY